MRSLRRRLASSIGLKPKRLEAKVLSRLARESRGRLKGSEDEKEASHFSSSFSRLDFEVKSLSRVAAAAAAAVIKLAVAADGFTARICAAAFVRARLMSQLKL